MARRYGDQAYSPRHYPAPRSQESRQAEGNEYAARPRADAWRPSTALELPVDEGFSYRWVREYSGNEYDPRRVTKMVRDGWSVVHLDALPPGFIADPDLHGDGYARHGGLIMMRIPKDLAEQHTMYYRQRRQAAVHGANELQGVAQRAEPGRKVVGVERQQFTSATGKAAYDALVP